MSTQLSTSNLIRSSNTLPYSKGPDVPSKIYMVDATCNRNRQYLLTATKKRHEAHLPNHVRTCGFKNNTDLNPLVVSKKKIFPRKEEKNVFVSYLCFYSLRFSSSSVSQSVSDFWETKIKESIKLHFSRVYINFPHFRKIPSYPPIQPQSWEFERENNWILIEHASFCW